MEKKFIPLIFIFLLLFSIILFSIYSYSTPTNTKLVDTNSSGSNFIPVSSPLTIHKPGYYKLTTDIIPTDIHRIPQGSCCFVNIYSSDVIFDGMGHTMDSGLLTSPCTHSTGIYVFDTPGNLFTNPNVIVKNVTLSHFNSGLSTQGVHDFRAENVSLINNSYGIKLALSSNVSVVNSIFINNKIGISGTDNEKVTIFNNKIIDSDQGMNFNGKSKFFLFLSPQISLAGLYLIRMPTDLPFLMTYKKITSGSEYLIFNNEIVGSREGIKTENLIEFSINNNIIQNQSDNGIWIENSDKGKIIDNTIANIRKNGILLRNCGLNFIIENNTQYNNGRKESNESYHPPLWSIIIGTIVIIFLGTPIIGIKFTQNKFLNYIWTNYLWLENIVRSSIRRRKISILFEGLIVISLIGTFIFGAAYALKSSVELTLLTFFIQIIVSGIVTVTPRAVQYLLAIRNKIDADYRLWWGGISIIIITLFPPFTSIFGQPVKFLIQDEAIHEKRKIILTKIVGPITTLLLSIGFFILYSMDAFSPYSAIGLQMSLLTSVVMLLPFSPMEGKTIWNWNKIAWAILFFPALFFYYIILIKLW